jgi:hypothetical protein
MVHEYEMNGLLVKTGDILCMADAGPCILGGQFWRYIGHLIPCEVSHVAHYVGPEGRCVEAGARGRVITFNITDHAWDAQNMRDQRGEMIDALYGIACPAEGRGLSESREREVRESVARYCLDQAAAGKPYNLDFFNPNREDAFYCSQLAYLAYLKHGIDLNTKIGIPHIPRTSSIIFPQEIWDGCVHAKCAPDGQKPGGASLANGPGAVSTAAAKDRTRLAG